MKKLATIALILVALALPVFGQSATLASPETTDARTKVLIGNTCEHRADPNQSSDTSWIRIEIWKMTAADAHPVANDINVTLTGAAINQYMNARRDDTPGENANGAANQNFRVLTWLKANTATNGVTIRCADPTVAQAACTAQVANMTVGQS